MLLTLVMSYYFFTDYLLPEDLLRLRFIALCIATLLVGAGGYIINDYLDVKIDLTNKPHKVVIGPFISRRWAMLLHLVFNVVAVMIGVMINDRIGATMFVCGVMLWLYSVYFKRRFLSGNILIATLSAYVILMLLFFDHGVSVFLVWSYALFAFTLTLIREIIKDTEDMRGDSKFDCKTVPIVLGIRKTRQILIALTGFMCVIVFMYAFASYRFIPFRHHHGQIVYMIYMILFVAVPLLVMIYLLTMADMKKDFSRLSTFAKLVMLTGMLSMLFIKL